MCGKSVFFPFCLPAFSAPFLSQIQGIPTVRTLNMRKLVEDPVNGQGCLLFSTDACSAKLKELARMLPSDGASSPLVELCWFFPVTREQYRLRCHVGLIYSDGCFPSFLSHSASPSNLQKLALNESPASSPEEKEKRNEQHLAFWKEHAANARSMFEIQRPGTLKRRAEQGDLDKYEPQPIDDQRPSRNFVTVLLFPLRCDYLKLPRPEDDTRGQIQKVQHSHESNLQPTRQQSRWLHTLDQQSGDWKAVGPLGGGEGRTSRKRGRGMKKDWSLMLTLSLFSFSCFIFFFPF